jgi:hypothetical protein
MKFKDFIYNKETKESHLLGWVFLVVVTLVTGTLVYLIDSWYS